MTALLERFHARLPGTAAFAMANRVVLLRVGDGVPTDVALGALPFEERAVERATDFATFEGHTVIKSELLPDGRRKLILKDRDTGDYVDRVVTT